MTLASAASPRPADWPTGGPIDLAVHDRPHASSTTEWWYVNAHVTLDDSKTYSVFAAFFRIVSGKAADGSPEYAHSLTWAITDVDTKAYLAHSVVDAESPRLGLEKIAKGHGAKDGRLNRAMEEVLKKGKVPRPDRVFAGPVVVPLDRLALDYAGCTFTKQSDGSYALHVEAKEGPRGPVGATLTFRPKKPPIRHGDDGLVRGVHGEDMFYYFVPRCDVSGQLLLDGKPQAVRQAQGWYDHEFGCPPPRTEPAAAPSPKHQASQNDQGFVAWNWVSAQLDDGTDVSVYDLIREDTGKSAGRWAIVIDPTGQRHAYDDFTLTPVPESKWRSVRTFEAYPTAYTVDIPKAQLSLAVKAVFEDQELVTVISKPAFWEGRVVVEGTHASRPTQGVGYVERSGFGDIEGLDDFYKRVGESVRASVRTVCPNVLDANHAQLLISAPERKGSLDGVDLVQLQRTLLAPVRAITDRGGKAWRSYAALACCDVVMGDSRKFAEWLSMPELMHVGSLIVDDVQDKSEIRRGGPAAHKLFGEAIALNSGTAAYFLGERLLKRSLVSDQVKLKLYDLYFEAVRAGHAGQAIDLDGLDAFVPPVLETGDAAQLEAKVLAIHRLKTAIPAACLARMGAVAGGGTQTQVDAIGRYFEAVGLAFQIIDDVLNLRGFAGDLKQKGEDLMQGKVTLPVARALGALGQAERTKLWGTISQKPQDAKVVGDCIATMERVGAIESCAQDARTMIEDAWAALDPNVEESLPKIMLRAFGWYVLERQY